jgi:citronellol/citronellal dehydrogenase
MINKLGMTISAISVSEEYKREGVAGNTLWPVGLVTTSALNHMMDNDPEKIDQMMQAGRTPQIQADAAYAIVTSDSKGFTGNMCIDEQVLRKAGVVRHVTL